MLAMQMISVIIGVHLPDFHIRATRATCLVRHYPNAHSLCIIQSLEAVSGIVLVHSPDQIVNIFFPVAILAALNKVPPLDINTALWS